MCIYIYIYVYLFVCLYIYIYIYTHLHTHTHTPTFTYLRAPEHDADVCGVLARGVAVLGPRARRDKKL